MWIALQAIFWTTVVCMAIVLAPIIGAIFTIGTIFYLVYAVVFEANKRG